MVQFSWYLFLKVNTLLNFTNHHTSSLYYKVHTTVESLTGDDRETFNEDIEFRKVLCDTIKGNEPHVENVQF